MSSARLQFARIHPQPGLEGLGNMGSQRLIGCIAVMRLDRADDLVMFGKRHLIAPLGRK